MLFTGVQEMLESIHFHRVFLVCGCCLCMGSTGWRAAASRRHAECIVLEEGQGGAVHRCFEFCLAYHRQGLDYGAAAVAVVLPLCLQHTHLYCV
jgi:hypothetical protein